MKSTPILCAALSLLLVGCGSLKERQDRARNAINTATGAFVIGVDKAKDVGDQLSGALTEASTKIQTTATEIQERANQVQDGVEKVTDAVNDTREAIDQVREGVDDVMGAVDGTEAEESE